MILDDIQPEYDVTEVHSIRIDASALTVFQCIKDILPSEIAPVMRFLVWLRSIPERLAGRERISMSSEEPLLSAMLSGNFVLLAEQAPRELVLGMLIPGKIGRVWDSSNLEPQCSNAEEFYTCDRPEYVRVVMNLFVEEAEAAGRVSVRTETRCQGLSHSARTNFMPYWRLIRPFSGLIRRVWLRGIKRKAESQAG